ncbi:hypothetical protein LTR56_028131 [Elasticomyces elasticus]|nr:hypothetical protein LTR56_028131 [Elasticomyces elasticus]KAK4889403.1 hypothetical protein LTR49_028793 [Elasticomyces elasticus]
MARPATSLAKDTFRKRKRTIMKKAQELSKLCHARVYLVVKYHGRFHVFTSETSRQWPPTVSEIETSYPPAEEYPMDCALTPATLAKEDMSESFVTMTPPTGTPPACTAPTDPSHPSLPKIRAKRL